MNFPRSRDRAQSPTPAQRRKVRFLPKSRYVIIRDNRAPQSSSFLEMAETGLNMSDARPLRLLPVARLDDHWHQSRDGPVTNNTRPRPWLSPGWNKIYSFTPQPPAPVPGRAPISPLVLNSSNPSPRLLHWEAASPSLTQRSLPLPLLPRYQPDDASTELQRLREAVTSSRNAEILHAYDVGVAACLESMQHHWNTRAAAIQTSTSEKRIFQREAQRLANLLYDADGHMLTSLGSVVNRQAVERDVWEDVSALSLDRERPPSSDSPPETAGVGLGIHIPGSGGALRAVGSEDGTYYYPETQAPRRGLAESDDRASRTRAVPPPPGFTTRPPPPPPGFTTRPPRAEQAEQAAQGERAPPDTSTLFMSPRSYSRALRAQQAEQSRRGGTDSGYGSSAETEEETTAVWEPLADYLGREPIPEGAGSFVPGEEAPVTHEDWARFLHARRPEPLW